MDYLIASLNYVMQDNYFWLAMSMTTIVGLFIGAVIYDGILKEAKKAAVVVLAYATLLSFTNYVRILPIIQGNRVHTFNQPFAGLVTILFVTIFFVLGMLLSPVVIKRAHRGKEC